MPPSAGRTFFIQQSSDLQNWTYTPYVDLGAGTDLEWQFSVTGASRTYFRLKFSVATDQTAGRLGDLDGDGLNNEAEVTSSNTDPCNPDTDLDGMPDGWEVKYGLNPLSALDASTDPDNDSFSSLKEYALGTNPRSNDSDTDGLLDNVDTRPALLDLPTFQLVSSWRKVQVTDSKEGSGAGISTSGYATGGGTAAGNQSKSWSPTTAFPWPLGTAANMWGTGNGSPSGAISMDAPTALHDMAQPLFACFQENWHGTSGFVVNAATPNSQECLDMERNAVLLERTIRIKATRAMPLGVTWRIPYKRFKATQTGRKSPWSAIPDSAIQYFVMNPGQIWSTDASTVVLNAGSLGTTACDKPNRTRPNAGSPWTENLFTSCRIIEWISMEKLPALQLTTGEQGDADGDGVPKYLEDRMGTDPTPGHRNSDGQGYADGDAINAGVLPPAEGFVVATRSVD